MKKIIFFTMLVAFLSTGFNAFSASRNIVNSTVKTEKIVITTTTSKNIDWLVCFATLISHHYDGTDMYGNAYYTDTYSVTCYDWGNLSPANP